jgi:O-antigen/teichoic acid export membrane protein
MSRAAVPSIFAGATLLDRLSGLIVRAGRTTFWPLVDQAVVSIGNFLTLVLVARALPDKADYGRFGLVLELIFYLNTIQTALVVYPLTVKGTVGDTERLRRLTSAALLITLVLSIPAMLIGLGAAAMTQQVELGIAASFALVAWQLQELVRRSLMAHLRHAAAAAGDALRYLGTAACVFAMWRLNVLTLPGVFWLIGALSLATALLQTVQVGLRSIGMRDLLELAREFWTSGRWMLLTSVTTILTSLLGVWTLSWCHGNVIVGDFYAIANFTKPVNPLLLTFTALVVQHAAKAYDANGIAAARRVAMKLSGLACLLIIPYLLLVMAAPGPAMRLFYGADNHFDDGQTVLALRLLAGGFMVLTLVSFTGAFLSGVHRTRENFLAQIVNSIATVAISFPLTVYFSLTGGLIGGIATLAVQLVALLYFVRRAV